MAKWTILAALSVALVGCSDPSDPESAQPNSGPDLFERLLPSHQEAFKIWKNNVIKTCSASAAFGADAPAYAGVDVSALMAVTNGSAVLQNDKNNFVVLSPGREMVGESKSSYSHGETLQAEARQSGSLCTIYLSGKKIYETRILQTVYIDFSSIGEKSIQQAQVSLNDLGTDPYALVSAKVEGLSTMVAKALAPKSTAFGLVGQKLGLSDADVRQYFRTAVAVSKSRMTAVLKGDDKTQVWSLLANEELIGRRVVFGKTSDATPVQLQMEVAVAMNKSFFGRSADQKESTVRLDVPFVLARNGTALTFKMSEIQMRGGALTSEAELSKCVDGRIEFAGTMQDRSANYIVPSVADLQLNCSVIGLHTSVPSVLQGPLRKALPVVLEGVIASKETYFAGWERVISANVEAALTSGKSISESLDPESKTLVVPTIERLVTRVFAEFELHPALEGHVADIVDMATNWALNNVVISDSEIRRIMNSLTNVVPVFPDSSRTLVKELRADPIKTLDLAEYADSLTLDYKEKALKAESLAKKAGDHAWLKDVFAHIIQLRVPIADIEAAIKRYENRR